MGKKALVLGINGQDGSYLADILLERGYEVHGLHRRSSVDNLWRIKHLEGRVTLHRGDVLDPQSARLAIEDSCPDELYNEADQDSVGWSHVTPTLQMAVTAGAVASLLESVRRIDKRIRVFQPCSAMMFGDAATLKGGTESPQSELTPFNPQSPYAIAKVAAYHLCRHYREQHGVFVSCGILYNHDSPRRSDHYLLHKICKAAVGIKRGLQGSVALGNLDARVDVGYAREYMEAAHAMLQLGRPDDFVIATGQALTVREMVELAFKEVGLEYKPGMVTADPEFYRPSPQSVLVGDWGKAQRAFGFCPKWDARRLIRLLIDAEQRKVS